MSIEDPVNDAGGEFVTSPLWKTPCLVSSDTW